MMNAKLLVRRYRSGETAQRLAQEMGWSNHRVARLLRKYNVHVRSKEDLVRRRIPDLKALARRYEAGETIMALAKEIGMTPGALRLHLMKVTKLRDREQWSKLMCGPRKQIPGLDRLIARYVAGESLNSICLLAGMDYHTIRKRLVAHGVPIRKGKLLPLEEMVRLYQAGVPISALSIRYKVTWLTVKKRLQAAGVPTRGQSKKHLKNAIGRC